MKGLPPTNETVPEQPNVLITGRHFWADPCIALFLTHLYPSPSNIRTITGSLLYPESELCICLASQFRKDYKLLNIGNSSGSTPWNKNAVPTETLEVTSWRSPRRMENSTENILESLKSILVAKIRLAIIQNHRHTISQLGIIFWTSKKVSICIVCKDTNNKLEFLEIGKQNSDFQLKG